MPKLSFTLLTPIKERGDILNVPIKVAARVYGKDPAWVRCGIREGWLPIGVAHKKENRYNYYISPKLLYEHTGYRYEETKQ